MHFFLGKPRKPWEHAWFFWENHGKWSVFFVGKWTSNGYVRCLFRFAGYGLAPKHGGNGKISETQIGQMSSCKLGCSSIFFQGLFRQETLWNTGLCQWFGISLQLIYLYKVPGIYGLLTRYHHVTLIIQLSVQDTHMPIPTWLSRRVTLDVRFLVAGTLGMVLGCLGDPCYQ